MHQLYVVVFFDLPFDGIFMFITEFNKLVEHPWVNNYETNERIPACSLV